ncbi:MAG: glc operon protein GlcG [Acidimicrobiales bacterium]|jgi:glc operon protein GlcG
MSDTIATRSITLAGAKRVLEAALAACEEQGFRMCITIADPSGESLLSARMDDAPRLSAGIAANKAYTVAGFGGMPTTGWWDVIKDEPALLHGIAHTPRLVVFGGGVGIFSDGALVGTIGVSGGTADEDAEIAAAGAAAIS